MFAAAQGTHSGEQRTWNRQGFIERLVLGDCAVPSQIVRET